MFLVPEARRDHTAKDKVMGPVLQDFALGRLTQMSLIGRWEMHHKKAGCEATYLVQENYHSPYK